MKTYPRLSVRRNSQGRYDAYLIKASWATEVWVSAGLTYAGALWWFKR